MAAETAVAGEAIAAEEATAAGEGSEEEEDDGIVIDYGDGTVEVIRDDGVDLEEEDDAGVEIDFGDGTVEIDYGDTEVWPPLSWTLPRFFLPT